MQHDDIIEIAATTRRRIQLPIRRIYEYEENIEVLIATKTNSKPERQENYTISIEQNWSMSQRRQRDRDPKTGLIDLLVYYEVPLGQRDEVKRKFNNFVRNTELKVIKERS